MSPRKERNTTMSAAGIVASIGLALIDRGVFLASRPAGWVVAGLFIAVPAVLVAYAAFREK